MKYKTYKPQIQIQTSNISGFKYVDVLINNEALQCTNKPVDSIMKAVKALQSFFKIHYVDLTKASVNSKEEKLSFYWGIYNTIYCDNERPSRSNNYNRGIK